MRASWPFPDRTFSHTLYSKNFRPNPHFPGYAPLVYASESTTAGELAFILLPRVCDLPSPIRTAKFEYLTYK